MEVKTRFSETELSISPITENDYPLFSDFSCGVEEIDDFFHHEMPLCRKYHYLIPYKCIVIKTGEIVGAFTLAHDLISLPFEEKVVISDLVPEYSDIFMRQTSYPAINIGHLAVRKDLQKKGIGSFVFDFVRMTFATTCIAGCQFLTVDALNIPGHRTPDFYEYKLGFEPITYADMGDHTRRMYLPLFSPSY